MRTYIIILFLSVNIHISFGQEYSVTAKSGLTVREKPSIRSKRIGKLEENKIVKIIENTNIQFEVENTKGFWLKLNFKGKQAYVYSGFLRPVTEITPQEIALNFYKWYLKNHYEQGGIYETPSIEMDENKTFYLDYENYKSSIKSTRYFSEKYFENNLQIYKDCEKALLNVNYEDVQECGCNPAEFTERNCVFSFYYVWTNGQGESLNTATLGSSKVNENNAVIIINVGYKGEEQNYEYSKPNVYMIKENGKWKISKIKV